MPQSRVRKAAKTSLKRPWVPAKHRDLVLYLVGLVLVGACVLFPMVHYWEYFWAKWAFAVEAGRGKPMLAKVETLEDHGRSVLPQTPCTCTTRHFPHRAHTIKAGQVRVSTAPIE